jgi:hypothetical protein
MSANFESILSTPADNFKAPQPLPPGVYVGSIVKPAEERPVEMKSGETTSVVDVFFRVTAPHSGINEEALAEMGGVPSEGKSVRGSYFPNRMHHLIGGLVHALSIDKRGKCAGEVISDAIGQPLAVQIKLTKDGEYNEVESIAAV